MCKHVSCSDLAEIRKQHGIPLKTLARCLGVSSQSVRKWELGQSSPSERHYRNYHNILLSMLENPALLINHIKALPKSREVLRRIKRSLHIYYWEIGAFLNISTSEAKRKLNGQSILLPHEQEDLMKFFRREKLARIFGK